MCTLLLANHKFRDMFFGKAMAAQFHVAFGISIDRFVRVAQFCTRATIEILNHVEQNVVW